MLMAGIVAARTMGNEYQYAAGGEESLGAGDPPVVGLVVVPNVTPTGHNNGDLS